jgi:hypothetical protein
MILEKLPPLAWISPLILAGTLLTTACDKGKTAAAATPPPAPQDDLATADTPVLRIKPGHEWKYLVTIENPKHQLSGKPESASFERVRRYLGKIDPGNGQPPSDCFEVSAKGAKTYREYVKIEPQEVWMTGQSLVDDQGVQTDLVWLEKPVTFFRAGLVAGDSLPLVMMNKDKNLWRVIRVIGRETVKVEAGQFDAARLQMFGKDGDIGLRRTYWFSPGVGIVREEKIREVAGKQVFSETDELIGMTPGID